jgi:uncharacterized membrane protein YozB (DUF420 family)
MFLCLERFWCDLCETSLKEHKENKIVSQTSINFFFLIYVRFISLVEQNVAQVVGAGIIPKSYICVCVCHLLRDSGNSSGARFSSSRN